MVAGYSNNTIIVGYVCKELNSYYADEEKSEVLALLELPLPSEEIIMRTQKIPLRFSFVKQSTPYLSERSRDG
jgi:hypothetical protein